MSEADAERLIGRRAEAYHHWPREKTLWKAH